MLKPFLIRDLHEDTQQDIIEDTASDLYNATDVSVDPQPRHGIVQLAAADYDEIAYIHPQARLSYLDDDDGDIITVGSSLELAQRLDEPFPQITETGFPATIHIFDIRRRKSVTDIWKRFEYKQQDSIPELPSTGVAKDNVDGRPTASEPHTSHGQISPVEDAQTNLSGNDSSESFLSAFEREMARLLNEPQNAEPGHNASEGPSSSRTAQGESASNLPRETAEAFAYALRNLMEVAESISTGVKAKLPELERHLDNARRALPNDITDSMRNTFLAFEEHVRQMVSSLNNLPDSIRRDNGSEGARLFPELPTPYDALNGLRDLGNQFGGMGDTLSDALQRLQTTFWGQEGSLFSNVSENRNSTSRHGPATSGPASHSGNLSGVSSYQSPPMTSWDPSIIPNFQYYPPANTWSQHNVPVHPFPPTTSVAPQSCETSSDLPVREQPSDESQSPRSLFIGNVGFNVTEGMIKDVFANKGLQVNVHLPLDTRTSKHAGFGYVTFASNTEATAGLRELQGIVIDGHCINFEYIDHDLINSLTPQETDRVDATTVSAPQVAGVINHLPLNDLHAPRSDDSDRRPTNESVHDLLLAQTEARFPPVSQLDAHMLAGRPEAPSPTSSMVNNTSNAGETMTLGSLGGPAGLSPPFPGSYPQDSQNVPRPESLVFRDDRPFEPSTETQQAPPMHYPSRPQVHGWPEPRPRRHPGRSATVRAPGPHRRSFDPFEPQPGLRRRATERHPLRHFPPPDPFSLRPRTSFPHLLQSAAEQGQNSRTHEQSNTHTRLSDAATAPIRSTDLDECISALSEMGFGTEENGGRQRLEIYAAAAKGVLADAIDMIEEEREAYQRRG
ncbi:hypothetical protein BDV18DRAFT_130247 [Aspergillus unguis]